MASRHGRRLAAQAVAGRSRSGAGALRPDPEQTAHVDPGDRAAAGADGAHVDLGNAEQVPAEHRLGRDDELAVANRRDVEGGATHVADDDVRLVGQVDGGDRRQRRPGHHRVDRLSDHLVGGHHAAHAIRHEQLAAVAVLAQRAGKHLDVGAHDRLQTGVDHHRDGAPVFARNRVELVAERHRHARPFAPDDLRYPALVVAVHDRPEEADPDRLHAHALEVRDRVSDVLLTKRRHLVAVGIDPAAYGAGAIARHVGLGIVQLPLEGALPRRLAQGQDVGKALVGDEPDPADLALDQGVGGDRGAMDDGLDLAKERLERHAMMRRRDLEDVDETALEAIRGRGRLEQLERPGGVADHAVGEGAADVDAKAVGHAPAPPRSSLVRCWSTT